MPIDNFEYHTSVSSGVLAGDYLWSNPNNWSSGTPQAGAEVSLDVTASVVDDVPSLSLTQLVESGSDADEFFVTGSFLSIATLNEQSGLGLLAYTVPLGQTGTVVVSIGSLTGSIPQAGADGENATLVVNAAAPNAHPYYEAGNGGEVILLSTPTGFADMQYFGTDGTFALEGVAPGSAIYGDLQNITPGDVLELPGTSVSDVIFGSLIMTVTTSEGSFTVDYSGSDPIDNYTANFDPSTGLEAITFGGAEIFEQNTAAATGSLAGDYLWSNPHNWSAGEPHNGAIITVAAAGYDDLPTLNLALVTEEAGGTIGLAGSLLNIATVISSGIDDSAITAGGEQIDQATSNTVTIGTIIGDGGEFGAYGPNARLIDLSATDPGEIYYVQDGGTMLITGPLSSSTDLIYEQGPEPNLPGTIALAGQAPGTLGYLAEITPGEVLELPVSVIDGVTYGTNSLTISTNARDYVFNDAGYGTAPVYSYASSFDTLTGLEAVTFGPVAAISDAYTWTGQGTVDAAGAQSAGDLNNWVNGYGINGVPGPPDSALFTIQATPSGTLDIQSLIIDSGVDYAGGSISVSADVTIQSAAGALSLSPATLNIGGTLTIGDEGLLSIDGPESSLSVTNGITLGVQGGTGLPSITIADGAQVTSDSGGALELDYIPDGAITIQTGGELTDNYLDLHDAASLVVESGGTLTQLGTPSSSDGDNFQDGLVANGTVLFDGGTLASALAYTMIGDITTYGGAGKGTLIAQDGSRLTNLATDLGEEAGDSGTLVLSGSGTSFTDTAGLPVDHDDAGLNVGVAGSGDLVVEDGATLSNPTSYIKIAQFAGAHGYATVTGAGSAMDAGGLLRVGDSGIGTLTVEDDASSTVGQVQVGDFSGASGYLTIASGGMLRTTDSTVDTGVQTGATVTAGAFDIGVQAGSKGAVDVDGGTLSIYGTLSVGDAGTGALDVSGATVTTAFLNVGALGSVTLAAGGTIEAGGVHVSGGSEIKLAGGALDPPAPVTIDAGGTIDGYGTLFGDVENNGLLLAEGGAVDISGAVTGDGILDIESGGTLVLSGTVAASQTISFSGSGALQLEPGAEIDTALNDLAVGDMIEVLGTSVSSVMFGASSLTITTSDGPITFSDVVYAPSPLTPDAYSASYDKSTGLEDITFTEVTCYVEGTKILTSRGEVAVESLRIGDSLKTLHAGEQKIKWIGTRSYGGRFIEGNKAALPICIKRNAIENNIPARDLFVSPGHAICIDGVLVHAARLVNGVSVVQAERVSSVTYYHIEMETHEIIFAENCPAETFIGEHFRQQFQNAAAFKELYPGEAATETTCLPRLDSGFQLHAIQQRIAARAGIDISAAPVQGPLRGYVDQAGPKLCCGWVQDILAPEEPVCLDITADGRTIGRVLANLYRADLYQAGYGSGYHGFEVSLPPGIKGRIDAVRTADRAALAWTEIAAARAA